MTVMRPPLVVEELRACIAGRDDIVYRAFTLQAGDIALVRGASGSGKSTLLHLLAGVFAVVEPGAARAPAAPHGRGRVQVGAVALHGLPTAARDALRPHSIGWMPQRQLAIASLSVLDNVLLPQSFVATVTDADRARAHGLLRALDVADLAERPPATLSIGQLARVCLARALVAQPRLLLVDEPSAALDDATTALVARQLLASAAAGMAVVVASHDAHLQALLAAKSGPPPHLVELAP